MAANLSFLMLLLANRHLQTYARILDAQVDQRRATEQKLQETVGKIAKFMTWEGFTAFGSTLGSGACVFGATYMPGYQNILKSLGGGGLSSFANLYTAISQGKRTEHDATRGTLTLQREEYLRAQEAVFSAAARLQSLVDSFLIQQGRVAQIL